MRLEGWESLLNEEVEEARSQSFKWGFHDCLTWATNCLLAITGVDYLAEIRGTYKTQAGAYRLIKKRGKSLQDCVSQKLPEISIKMAKRGDLLMYNGALGICFGINGFFVTEESGLTPVKTLSCEYAWTID